MPEFRIKPSKLVLSCGILILIDQLILALSWFQLISIQLVMDRWLPWSVVLTGSLAIVIILVLWFKLSPRLRPGWLVVGMGTLSNLVTVLIYRTSLDYLPFFQFTLNLADLLIIGGLIWLAWRLFEDIFDQSFKST